MGLKTITVTQSWDEVKKQRLYIAFDEYLRKLRRNDTVPRGRFFKGKTPGPRPYAVDEFWSLGGTQFLIDSRKDWGSIGSTRGRSSIVDRTVL